MPPKQLSEEKVKEAEVRAKIKEIYKYLATNIKNKKLPHQSNFTSGKLETLRKNLLRLEAMQKEYEVDKLKDRIVILYNRFKKDGEPLPEPLQYYTENKSLVELTQIERDLEKELGNIDIGRVHQKLVKEIESVISALSRAGDKEPSNNSNKYIGTPNNEFDNDTLRDNLKILQKRLESYYEKQAQPRSSTNVDPTNKWVPKPEAQPSSSTTPIPKPGAKKSKGKEKQKDEDDTIILNNLTKMSDSELEKYSNNDELKKQFIISLYGADITTTDMNILIGKLNNEIRVLKERKRKGAPIRGDVQPITMSKRKNFDNAMKVINDLVAKNNIEGASELAIQLYNVITTSLLKGEMSQQEYEEIKNEIIYLIRNDKSLKGKKIGKYFHHDFLTKNIKKVSIL